MVSLAVAAAVALSLPDMHRVLAVFGVWAILSGILQLATGARRRKGHGAQWPMLLSGARSALAGGFFVVQSSGAVEPSVAGIESGGQAHVPVHIRRVWMFGRPADRFGAGHRAKSPPIREHLRVDMGQRAVVLPYLVPCIIASGRGHERSSCA